RRRHKSWQRDWSSDVCSSDLWDANQIPVLVDAEINGRPRAVVVMANRNAFYYALDRKSGEFLIGTPYAKQTWARGLDARGRPIVIGRASCREGMHIVSCATCC